MIAVIRISGQVNLTKDVKETLDRLRLRKKLTCVFVDEKDAVLMGMVRRVENYVAYGKVDDALMKKVIEKRGDKNSKKEYKGFCRLHPPIGGFKKSTKTHSPRGVLGKHEDIAKLLERML